MNHRFQWAWERDTAEQAWLKTMYWDCLFAANLFLEDRAYPADVAAPAEAAFAAGLMREALVVLASAALGLEVDAKEEWERAQADHAKRAEGDVFRDPPPANPFAPPGAAPPAKPPAFPEDGRGPREP